MQKQQIGVIVNMPITPEGMSRLSERIADMNAKLVAGALNKINAPYEAKVAYLKSLNGVVPWAKTAAKM